MSYLISTLHPWAQNLWLINSSLQRREKKEEEKKKTALALITILKAALEDSIQTLPKPD